MKQDKDDGEERNKIHKKESRAVTVIRFADKFLFQNNNSKQLKLQWQKTSFYCAIQYSIIYTDWFD